MALQLQDYLNAPNECPYCHSEDVSGEPHTDFDDIYAWRMIVCDKCGKQWREEFQITHITEYDDNGDPID